MGELTLVTGGARSGKSRFAEELAASAGGRVVYLATMASRDEELELRIARHRERRPAAWQTVEEPLEVVRTLETLASDATVLLDCLTLWVSNLMARDVPDWQAASAANWDVAVENWVGAARALCTAQSARTGRLIAVTNEVGMGIVPGDALSRAFRDGAGLVNQVVAESAAQVILMVSGRPLTVPRHDGV